MSGLQVLHRQLFSRLTTGSQNSCLQLRLSSGGKQIDVQKQSGHQLDITYATLTTKIKISYPVHYSLIVQYTVYNTSYYYNYMIKSHIKMHRIIAHF